MGQESSIYLGPDVSMSQSGDSRPQRRLLLTSLQVLRFQCASDSAGQTVMLVHGLAAHHTAASSRWNATFIWKNKECMHLTSTSFFCLSPSLIRTLYFTHKFNVFQSLSLNVRGFWIFHATASGFHSVFQGSGCGNEPQSLVNSSYSSL